MREDGVAEVDLLARDRSVCATVLLDAADLELVDPYRWRLIRRGTGYAYGRPGGARGSGVGMHRLVLDTPDGSDVDHINGDGLDNRRSNLRIATRSQNLQNRRGAVPGSRSSYRGVDFWRGYWRARAKVGGRSFLIGYFHDEKEAGEAAAAWRAEHMPRSSHDRSPCRASRGGALVLGVGR